MHKKTKVVSMLLAFVLMLAVGVSLGVPATGANNSATETTTKALASAEDLSGTITMIDPVDKEITLVGSNGVPYDFELTKRTQVELANQKIGMNELSSESHKQATIHFVPKSDGNLAESIQINAS